MLLAVTRLERAEGAVGNRNLDGDAATFRLGHGFKFARQRGAGRPEADHKPDTVALRQRGAEGGFVGSEDRNRKPILHRFNGRSEGRTGEEDARCHPAGSRGARSVIGQRDEAADHGGVDAAGRGEVDGQRRVEQVEDERLRPLHAERFPRRDNRLFQRVDEHNARAIAHGAS